MSTQNVSVASEPVAPLSNGKAHLKPGNVIDLGMARKFLTELQGTDANSINGYAFEVRILEADFDRQDRIIRGGKYKKTIAACFLSPDDAVKQLRRVGEV